MMSAQEELWAVQRAAELERPLKTVEELLTALGRALHEQDADAPAGLGQFKGDAAAQPARGAGDKGNGNHGCAFAFGAAGTARLGK